MSIPDARTVAADASAAGQYRLARRRMQALATEVTEEQAGAPVPACPDWTVTDLLAHVTGLAADLGAGRRPAGDTQAWVDGHVALRRGRSAVEVAAEWDAAAPGFESMIDEKPHRWWGLVYDLIVHEHDLRGAVGRPGERDGDAVRLAVELGLRLVAADLEKHSLPALRLVTEHDTRVVGDGAPELVLETSAFEALRLLGSRRTIEQLRAAPFTGDVDRYLPGLAHMDLPTAPLGE